MAGGLLRRDAAGVDEGLHISVVAGDLAHLAVTQEVGARVADVQHRDARRLAADQASAVSVVPMPASSGLADTTSAMRSLVTTTASDSRSRASTSDSPPGSTSDIVAIAAADASSPAGVAAHAVGDDEQLIAGVPGVLVAAADEADVGARGGAQHQGHGVTSAARGRCGRP